MGNIIYLADSQDPLQTSYSESRECGLEICMFSKQVILRLLKVYESLTKGESLRGTLSQRSTVWRKGTQDRQAERKRLGFHPEAWTCRSDDTGSAPDNSFLLLWV